MQRQPLSSKSIASVGYDTQSQTLEVEFIRGGVYQVSDVAAEVYAAFLAAPSAGAFFNEVFKGGGFRVGRVRG